MSAILFLLISVITVLPSEIIADEILPDEFRLTGLFFGCSRDVTGEYHRALQDFSTRLFKKVAKENDDHFVLSQYSIWLALSSLVEGSDGEGQKKLFKALNLPEDSCLREKYYEIATSRESSAEDVTLTRKRILMVDEEVKVNMSWVDAVRASGLIDTQKIALKNNSEVKIQLKDIVNGSLNNLELTGNSILLDSLDYEGLWTTGFDNASTETNADFFNDKGERIGKVDLFKMKRRVKLAHIPLLHAKLLELPVGNNGRYRMLFILNHGRWTIRRTIENFPPTFIVDMMPLLVESVIPLEIAIPKFKMTSELDLKTALEGVGFASVWKGENVSRYISEPPLQPSTFYQRVSVSIDQRGLSPQSSSPLQGITNIATDLASVVGRGFTANRPFIYGLVDAETRTWLFAGAFTKPQE